MIGYEMYINLPRAGKREHNAQRLPEYLTSSALPKLGVAVDRHITRMGIVVVPVSRMVSAAAQHKLMSSQR